LVGEKGRVTLFAEGSRCHFLERPAAAGFPGGKDAFHGNSAEVHGSRIRDQGDRSGARRNPVRFIRLAQTGRNANGERQVNQNDHSREYLGAYKYFWLIKRPVKRVKKLSMGHFGPEYFCDDPGRQGLAPCALIKFLRPARFH
jgi:hypothetical protein